MESVVTARFVHLKWRRSKNGGRPTVCLLTEHGATCGSVVPTEGSARSMSLSGSALAAGLPAHGDVPRPVTSASPLNNTSTVVRWSPPNTAHVAGSPRT